MPCSEKCLAISAKETAVSGSDARCTPDPPIVTLSGSDWSSSAAACRIFARSFSAAICTALPVPTVEIELNVGTG